MRILGTRRTLFELQANRVELKLNNHVRHFKKLMSHENEATPEDELRTLLKGGRSHLWTYPIN